MGILIYILWTEVTRSQVQQGNKKKNQREKIEDNCFENREKKLVKSPITVKQLHVQEKKETSLFIKLPRHVEEIDWGYKPGFRGLAKWSWHSELSPSQSFKQTCMNKILKLDLFDD
jgi:hypothetical protein